MTSSPPARGGVPADDCAEPRVAVAQLCEDAHRVADEANASEELVRDARRDLTATQHRRAAAEQAAEPQLRITDKAKAREDYERAKAIATTEEERVEATGEWARAVDHINRAGRLAQRALTKARREETAMATRLFEAERREQTGRIHAEQAEAACLDARVRLAACEEQSHAPASAGHASVFEPHAATGGHAVTIPEAPTSEPLVIESLVTGDRVALELAAAQVRDQTGLTAAAAQLQLQELVDAVMSQAAEEGYLVFDTNHPFWAALSFEEARDVVAALARLGFQFEPSEGWHAGRAPSPGDLSMALAYAGLDSRNMRDLPTTDDLRELPRSIGVDARSYLAAQAADLAVDHVVHLLGRRAEALEPLWNEWGQIRPILLSDRRQLGSVPG